jgi:hypothetical protein
MRRALPVLLASGAIFLSQVTFAEDHIVRQGFTLSLSMGAGAAYVSPKDSGSSRTQGLYVDVAPIFTSNFFILTYQGGFAWQYY